MALRFSSKGAPGALLSSSARKNPVFVVAQSPRLNARLTAAGLAGFQPSGGHAGHSRRSARLDTSFRLNAAKDGSDPGASKEDMEVKVDAVKMLHGSHVVYLKIVGTELLLPVHIGEAESNAISRELTKTKQTRPMTHDFAKTLLQACGFRVTRIRITDLVSSTYYSRVHIGRANRNSVEFVADVDARPSDAINLALRFGAPMYISKKVAENATAFPSESASGKLTESLETPADIVRSVRTTLSSFEDPTVMFQLHKSLAIQQQRYEDAQLFQERIFHEMTHNQLLRLVVAMEAALTDSRYEEAARLRDEYYQMQAMVNAGKKNKEAAL
eukprot:gene14726-20770_t